MEAFGKKEACHFNLLITKSVPHILEKILFSLDYESFNKCSEVNTALSELLSSERSLKLKKNVFGWQYFRRVKEKSIWLAIFYGRRKDILLAIFYES